MLRVASMVAGPGVDPGGLGLWARAERWLARYVLRGASGYWRRCCSSPIQAHAFAGHLSHGHDGEAQWRTRRFWRQWGHRLPGTSIGQRSA